MLAAMALPASSQEDSCKTIHRIALDAREKIHLQITQSQFKPVDPRVQKRMTLEVQLADIRVSVKDVRNFLESDYIENYNTIDEYLFQCYDKWDGKDHIRALARTVPTNNPYWS